MGRLDELRDLAAGCTACDLYKCGTQVVFGEGTEGADVMLVGEQPGDVEDREGRPFVRPAGRILDRGLADAGIDRTRAYVTNAVKHFKWTPGGRGGKARIHKKLCRLSSPFGARRVVRDHSPRGRRISRLHLRHPPTFGHPNGRQG